MAFNRVESSVVVDRPQLLLVAVELLLELVHLFVLYWIHSPELVPNKVLLAGRQGGAAQVHPAVVQVEYIHGLLEVKGAQRCIGFFIQVVLIQPHLIEEQLHCLVVSLSNVLVVVLHGEPDCND